MSKHFRNELKSSLIIPVGWLFADLLLALAMLFLVANTIGDSTKAKSIPTPTPVPKPTVTPTPSPIANLLILDSTRVTFIIQSINPDLLSQGDTGAINDLENKLRDAIKQKHLQARRAGIAIAYGGADDFSQEDRGASVAAEVYKVLGMLGRQAFVFCHTIYYDPLFTRNHPHDTVVIDIYFFSASAGGC